MGTSPTTNLVNNLGLGGLPPFCGPPPHFTCSQPWGGAILRDICGGQEKRDRQTILKGRREDPISILFIGRIIKLFLFLFFSFLFLFIFLINLNSS
jgi:hypothetical protein